MAKQTPPVEKNETIEVTFEDLTHEGQGVAKVDGFPLFVPYGLPGEKATVKVVKLQKGYGFARIMEMGEASPDRVEPPCPIYKECGGCSLQHLSYEGQLRAKQKHVQDVMQRIGGFPDVNVLPTLGMDNPWTYRNKAQVPVGEREGGLIAGFYQKRSHEIIDMETCMIQGETNDQLVQHVKEICQKYGVEAYNEKTHKGNLRHIMVRTGANTDEIMLVLITRTDGEYGGLVPVEFENLYRHLDVFVQMDKVRPTDLVK